MRPNGAPQPPAVGRIARRLSFAAAFAIVVVAIAALLAPVFHIASAPAADIILAGRALRVTIADTALRRTWGLQGRLALEDGRSMLFAFERPRVVTFARRSLTFPVDVVFVSADGLVTGVAPWTPITRRRSRPTPRDGWSRSPADGRRAQASARGRR